MLTARVSLATAPRCQQRRNHNRKIVTRLESISPLLLAVKKAKEKMKNKKMPGVAGRAASKVGGGELEALCDYNHPITSENQSQPPFSTERKLRLAELDAAMAAADQAGDDESWIDAFLAWLDVFFQGVSDGC